MDFKTVEEYREYVKKKIDGLTAIFAKASIGDFSDNLALPDEEDEFTQVYVGIQVMLEVIRDQLGQLNALNQDLQQEVKEKTAAFQEAEQGKVRDEAIMESMGDGLIVTDRVGTIALVNQQTVAMLGYTKEELVGHDIFTAIRLSDEKGVLVPPENRPARICLSTGQKVKKEYYYHKKNGERFPISVIVTPIEVSGQVIGAVELFRDITREKEVERAKDDFVSIASHQLRTPLTAIKWFCDILLDDTYHAPPEKEKEILDKISKSNQRMIDLVNALLNISRIESGRIRAMPRPTVLQELLHSIVEEARVLAVSRGQTLELSIDKEPLSIVIDPQLIRLVYQNLLSNAIRYTPKGGTITLGVTKETGRIISQVKDTGYGIPAVSQSKIFQRFFRAENIVKVDTEGSGLGLYLVKAIVESSGGQIWFESQEGAGTTFWFTLPSDAQAYQKDGVALEQAASVA